VFKYDTSLVRRGLLLSLSAFGAMLVVILAAAAAAWRGRRARVVEES
jgi:hypothetical protein